MFLPTFEIEPTEPQRGSVIWLHGLGASNHDFEDVIPELNLPGVRFVFPAAPELPVTINGGVVMPAWYDILSFDDPPLREDEPSVRRSAELVAQVLQREISRGVPAGQIVLMGFSQGGAMALHVGARATEALAGIAVLSGYLLLPDHFARERHPNNLRTPTLLCHGKFDPIVPFALGRRAYQTLRATSDAVEFHSFDMPHALCQPELLVLRAWLKRRLER